MADIAHIAGLVAPGEARNPFDYCDVGMCHVAILRGVISCH